MRQYIALIHKDAGSDYGVSFPDLPGCVTAGLDLDDARAMAEEALALHLAGMAEDEEPIPEPSSLEAVMADRENRDAVAILVKAPPATAKAVRVNMTIPEDELEQIDKFAVEQAIPAPASFCMRRKKRSARQKPRGEPGSAASGKAYEARLTSACARPRAAPDKARAEGARAHERSGSSSHHRHRQRRRVPLVLSRRETPGGSAFGRSRARSWCAGGPISSIRRSPKAGSTAPSTWRKSSARAAGCNPRTTISRGSAPRLACPSPSTRSSARPTPSTPIVSFAGRRRPAFRREVADRLFKAYFVEGRDIGDRNVLVEIAERMRPRRQ